MIKYVKGNLFESPAQVLVNTVNTEGVMGKGIALEFKKIYPEMFKEYRQLCEAKRLDIGTLHLYKTARKWILNFPTKKTWRQSSKPEYIEAGLKSFLRMYVDAGIHSIAFPPLGCGNGELDFNDQVRPIMESMLGPLSIDVFIYPPRPREGKPEHRDVEAIRAWLRSEPASLPFDEVWEDLRGILESNQTFRTITGKGTFTAAPWTESERGIVVHASGRVYAVEGEELLEFWQQLRQHGFLYRSITSRQSCISYLLPIFEMLDYVDRVEVSDTSSGLERNASVALQVRPPARPPDDGDLFAQHAE